ncbi:Protein of unknown function [Lachnospiraceae bacterium]|nr:Protein of unknown function [Lachnospiraceae bacterium]
MKEYIKKLLLEICISYTSVSVTGAVINAITGMNNDNSNTLIMFAFCVIASIVLSLYSLFENISPLAMMIIQYVASCFFCGLFLLAVSRLDPISPRGWFEYYRSFTIPYIIIAGIFYYYLFREAKEQSRMIQELQEKKSL